VHELRHAIGMFVAAALVVVGTGSAALAVSACATGPASTVSTTTTRPTPKPALLVIPSTLAPGIDQVAGSAFPTSTHWVVFVDQCLPCQAVPGTHTEWVAVSNDAGRSWTVRRTAMRVLPRAVMFADARDGWTASGWVTHDGGLTWSEAKGALGSVNDAVIVGNRVWAQGEVDRYLVTRVATGAVTGSALKVIPVQPLPRGYYPGSLVAPSPSTVYLQAWGPSGAVMEVTRNGGRTWELVKAPCGAREQGQVRAPIANLSAFTPERLYLLCGTKTLKPPGMGRLLSFSADGGRTWTRVAKSSRSETPSGWQTESSTVGWTGDGGGGVLRTTDGGRSWQVVSSPISRSRYRAGTLESIVATSPAQAFATYAVTTSKGTYFLIWETSDAGSTWDAVSAFTLTVSSTPSS